MENKPWEMLGIHMWGVVLDPSIFFEDLGAKTDTHSFGEPLPVRELTHPWVILLSQAGRQQAWRGGQHTYNVPPHNGFGSPVSPPGDVRGSAVFPPVEESPESGRRHCTREWGGVASGVLFPAEIPWSLGDRQLDQPPPPNGRLSTETFSLLHKVAPNPRSGVRRALPSPL